MLGLLFGNVFTAVIVVLLFGLTIFIHELGHFLVARWCGLEIKTFSIGFGPAIWSKKIDGVVYKVCWLPLGGYVALPQLDPNAMSTVQGNNETGAEGEPLPSVAPWRKILVSVAGATGNVLLAFVLAWLVFWRGMPATLANQETLIGFVEPGSSLYQQGVRIGDRIVSVEGTSVQIWSEFAQEAAMHDEVVLGIVGSDGTLREVVVETEPWQFGVRMVSGVEPRESVVVGEADPGMRAYDAGVRAGDEILAYAGTEIHGISHMVSLVRAHGDGVHEILVRRGRGAEAEDLTFLVEAQPDEDGVSRIGVRFSLPEQEFDTGRRVHPRPMAQIRLHSTVIFRFLRDLMRPRTSARAANMVGGPVMIIVYYFGMVQASLMLALWFTGFLNINLAIINLLPIPILDGGHIMFSVWESIFRKPIHPKIVNILVNLFGLLLLLVFLLLTFRDVDRSPLGRRVRDLIERDDIQEELVDGAVVPHERTLEETEANGGLD